MRSFPRPSLLPLALAAALLVGCGGDAEPIEPGGPAPADDAADGEQPGEANAPVDEESPVEFDEEAATARAEELLDTPEAEVPTDDPDVRILRRGDEDLPGTMDLRPGRANLYLDDDGDGTFVVTRVEVETPDGTPIVIE